MLYFNFMFVFQSSVNPKFIEFFELFLLGNYEIVNRIHEVDFIFKAYIFQFLFKILINLN